MHDKLSRIFRRPHHHGSPSDVKICLRVIHTDMGLTKWHWTHDWWSKWELPSSGLLRNEKW